MRRIVPVPEQKCKREGCVKPPGAVVASFGGVTGPGMRPVGTFAGTTTTGNRHPSAPQGTNPGTGPGSAASNPSAPAFGSSIVGDRPAFAQPRSSGMIYVLVAVLLAAISVLTFLLVSSK